MSGAIPNVNAMNLLARLHIPPAIHVRLTVAGHSEFERVIELPSGASPDWLVSTYLLSLGIHNDDVHHDLDRYLDLHPASWRPKLQTMRLPEIPHEIEVLVMDAGVPEVGDPCVALIEPGPNVAAPFVGRWQSDTAPCRLRHVNDELAQRFGVVVPHFDDSGLERSHGIRSSSRLDSLLRALAPLRRLALLAHLDESEILADRPLELNTVESAMAPLISLLTHIGPAGLVQDPETGWITDGDVAVIVRELEWTPVDGISAPEESLVSFARQSKLIRRLKGRVLVTVRGRKLLELGTQTLNELADAVTQRDDRYGGWRSYAQSHDQALALLAIADGSAKTFAELPPLVGLGKAAIGKRGTSHGYDDDDVYESPFDHAAMDADTAMTANVQQIIDNIAVLSESGRFGMISPAMRAVARVALL